MKNLFLMIKQGMKWIYNLKLQLIIIMFLTFIASTILTISFTTNQRLEKEYNTVVNTKKTPKFDSTYNITVGSKAKPEKNSTLFLPIFDFIKKDWTGMKESNNYNLVFNNIYGYETLITKTIESNEFKTAWTSYLDMFDIKNNHKDGDTKVAENQEKFDFAIDDAFFNTMINLLSSNHNSIKNTVIYKYTQKNKDWYKEYLIDNGKSNWSKFINNKNFENLRNNKNQNLKIYNYSYYAFESISQYLFKNVRFFINRESELLNKIRDLKDRLKTAKLFYEFFFGKQWDQNTKIEEKYITNKQNKYTLQFDKNPVSEFENIITLNKDKNQQPTKNDGFFKLIISKGFRGVLRPLYIKGSSDEIEKVEWWNQTNELEGKLSDLNNYVQNVDKISAFKTNGLVNFLAVNADEFANIGSKAVNFYSNLEKNDDDFLVPVPRNYTITSAFLTHNLLAANANGYGLYIRPEIIFTDHVTKKTYRIVDITNTDFTNYEMLTGEKSSSPSEITVSKQFAKANKIKIGGNISLGQQSSLLITGYSTDTYSFFPTSDPKVPLPKSKSGGIVYAKRSTISNILGKQDKADNNDNTSMFNFFLYKQKDASNLNQVYLDQFADSSKIYNNIVEHSNPAQTFYSQFSFKDSFYSLNWTLYERVSYYYNLTTLLSAIVIALVTSLAVFYGVYKSIKNNAKQIGILKANGMYAQVIALSYLSYSIILTVTVIPLGWMLGTVLQVPFVGILQDYFGLKSNIIAYNSSSILLTILIFGLILGVFSYLIALLNIKKPVLNIINRTDRWSKPIITNWLSEHVFKKVSFTRIITFKIAEAGKKPLMLLTGLLFVATLFISVAVALPSVALNAKDKYFKNIKYNNEYNLTDSLTNAPLGKDSINMWYGHESLSKFSKATNLNGRSIEYYENPNDYLRNISNNSALPALIYNVDSSKGEIINPLKLYVNQYAKTGNADLPDKLLGWLSYQFTIANGRALSIGTIEQLYSYFLNDIDLENRFNSDDDRITEVNEAATPLTTVAGQAISQLFKIKDAKIDDWRQTMLDFLLAYTPSLVKSYLTSESRKEQLSFGFQTQSIVPKKDQLATMFTPLSNNSKASYSVLGLDKAEDSLNIRKKDKEKVFLTTKDSKEINKVFNQAKGSVNKDIYLNSVNSRIKIYDHITNTVIVPTIINKPLASIIDSNSDKVLENISANNNQLTFKDKNGNFNNLPRQAWIYDDTDYVNTNYVKSSSFNKPMQNTDDSQTINNYEVVGSSDNLKYYLNPYNLDTNKFTQKQVIDLWSDKNEHKNLELANSESNNENKPENKEEKDPNLLNQIESSHDGIVKDSPLFGDFVIKNDGSIERSFIRPYYQMRNLLLFIPKHDSVSWQEYAAYASKWNKYNDVTTVDKNYLEDLKLTDDKVRNIKQPSVSVISKDMVPKSVKDAWNSALDTTDDYNGDYIAIRPYDFSLNQKRDDNEKAFEYFVFDTDGKILGVKKQVSNKLIDNLVLDGVPHFYRRALGQRHNVAPILKNQNRQVTYVNKDLKIKFKKVANLELYGKAMAIVDSDLANLIYGYDTSRSTNYNYQPFDTSRVESTGKYFKKYKTTKWNKISTNEAWKDSFIGSEDAYSYSPHYYFNTLYSNVKEPLGISSSISIVADKKIGNTILDITEFSDYKASVTDLKFIAEIKQLLDQLAKTAVYVAIIIILSVALSAALLIMLVVDIYVSEYKSFMIMLKSMGYTNAQIIDFTVRISIFASLIVIILTVIMVFGIVSIINSILYVRGFVLPIGYSWIAPLISILMIFSSFFSSLWLSTRKIRKTDVSVAIHAND